MNGWQQVTVRRPGVARIVRTRTELDPDAATGSERTPGTPSAAVVDPNTDPGTGPDIDLEDADGPGGSLPRKPRPDPEPCPVCAGAGEIPATASTQARATWPGTASAGSIIPLTTGSTSAIAGQLIVAPRRPVACALCAGLGWVLRAPVSPVPPAGPDRATRPWVPDRLPGIAPTFVPSAAPGSGLGVFPGWQVWSAANRCVSGDGRT